MDCPHRIPLSGMPATHHKSYKNHHARLSLMHHCDDRDRWSWYRSQSNHQRHHSSSHCYLDRGHSRSQNWDRQGHHRSSSQWSHSAPREHSNRPCHDTLHQSHCQSAQNQSSSGYWFQDCRRSHSPPSNRSSRHESCRSDSHSSRMRRTHPRKNMKVRIEDPDTDY